MTPLSPDQIREFRERGFLKLPGLIPAPLLTALRAMFDRLLVPEPGPDKVVIESRAGKFVTNIDLVCPKGDLSCLELLGFPPILALAQALCGDDFFLIQEFAVIKHRGDDAPVLWHRDMVHRRTGTCFTMGIYLDDADPGDGALQVIEGSHRDPRDICALLDEPWIDLPMRAGDVLIHDMMLAHGSTPAHTRPLRRVIYFEFLSAAQVSREAIYPDEVVARRTRLLHAATRLRGLRHPEEASFPLPLPNPASDDAQLALETVLNEIYAQPIRARPSSYCINGIATFASFD